MTEWKMSLRSRRSGRAIPQAVIDSALAEFPSGAIPP